VICYTRLKELSNKSALIEIKYAGFSLRVKII